MALRYRGNTVADAFWVLPCAVAAYWPVERGRRGMLGDSGANLLGATLGCTLAMSVGFPIRVVLVSLLLGFHLFTERRSLNEYIAVRPRLRAFDHWIQGPDPFFLKNEEGASERDR